ncbi:hypothetical protein WBN73_15505 [Paenarthrobacter sp. CCNWLY172]|uniref:Uncharacterized protein n=1 Tax=Paenarthrobacter sp. AMU7 TaxID=3162492 RepID=A0AB39YPW7_9MICC|nr:MULTISPECIES: hypothetical protein [Micrococcaceae]MCD4850487.1 hypothetical protein [Arthrobacter sp. AK01]MCP1411886.1 hypothetical protein [Paenarthrobacter sp. A20]QSZ47277.1 hypothetical protein AYX22_01820 [Arthrobacter sp. D5-1]WGM20891.1 hypothetical protein QEH68_01495 [Paenarthrobacter sp. OM7]
MKSIALLRERATRTMPTGSHCPASGLWSPDSDPDAVQVFPEGHVLPAHNGVATVWRRRTAAEVSA